MLKNALCFVLLLFASLASGQQQSLHEFEQAKLAASKGSGALFVLATTEGCPPCEQAKRLLGQDVRLSKHTVIELPIQDCAKLRFGRSTLIAPSPLLFAPKLLMVDVADLIDGITVIEVGSITTKSIDDLLDRLPVELLAPVVMEFEDEPVTFGAARVVKYAIATQYPSGAYNSTFEWAKIDRYLQAFERYYDVDFQRVSRGQNITFLQSNRPLSGGPTVAARAGGSTVSISPVFNFGNGPWCGIVTLHETLHLYGGSSHNRDPNGLMGVSGGRGSILQSDYPWLRTFKVRPGVKRPHEEPEWLMQWLSGAVAGSDGSSLLNDNMMIQCPVQ